MKRLAYAILLAVPAAALAGPPAQWQPVDQAVADLDPLSVSQRRVETGLRSTGEQTTLYRVVVPGVNDRFIDPGANAGVNPGALGPKVVYYQIVPGVRAKVTRVDYLVKNGGAPSALDIAPTSNGQFVKVVGADTVFELGPAPTQAVAQPSSDALPAGTPVAAPVFPASAAGKSPRVDGRITDSPTPAAPAASSTSVPVIAGQLDARIDGRLDARVQAPAAAPGR